MPEAEIKKRGGAKRYRTLKLPGNKFVHLAIVKKAGPKGGHTVAGPVRKKKAELDWNTPRNKADRILKRDEHI